MPWAWHGVWFRASSCQSNQGNQAMPKTLPAIVAVAVIAFSIGFNTARYPIVWEMVGASAHLPEESGGAESAAAPQPAKADEVIASIPSDNPALSHWPKRKGTTAVFSDQAAAVKAEPAGAESSPAYVPLVPVPGYLFNGNGFARWRTISGRAAIAAGLRGGSDSGRSLRGRISAIAGHDIPEHGNRIGSGFRGQGSGLRILCLGFCKSRDLWLRTFYCKLQDAKL